MEQTETVHITQNGVVDPRLGVAYIPGRDYRMPKAHADVRYQRGHGRPAAEVYLERLRELGVVGIAITKDAEPSIRLAAAKTGVACKAEAAGGRGKKS